MARKLLRKEALRRHVARHRGEAEGSNPSTPLGTSRIDFAWHRSE